MINNTYMVEVKGARKAYGALEVLKGIDLCVARGQIIAIIGPSGSGKSTLLRSINHLEVLNDGEVWLDGEQVNRPLKGRAYEQHINAVRQQMGMVFQHFNLFPHLTVYENIALGPLKLKGLTKKPRVNWRWNIWQKSDWPTNLMNIPPASLADRNSGLPSQGHWQCSPKSCCSMRPHRRWTPSWSKRSTWS